MRTFLLASIASVSVLPGAANASGLYGRVELGFISSDLSGSVADLPLGGFLGVPNSDVQGPSKDGFTGLASLNLRLWQISCSR